jgi:hypothetical protein
LSFELSSYILYSPDVLHAFSSDYRFQPFGFNNLAVGTGTNLSAPPDKPSLLTRSTYRLDTSGASEVSN